MIGHEAVGVGKTRLIVLNDWICDTSTWDGARPYLDGNNFTWAFADLRGYGRSKGISGKFVLTEAVDDVVALADELGWGQFAVLGHSMSSLVALHLAQHFPERISKAIVVTPVPPTGVPGDEAMFQFLRGMALGDDATRIGGLSMMWGSRLSEGWTTFKATRWRAAAEPLAVAEYIRMWLDGLPNPSATILAPLLAVTGEQDAEFMRQASVQHLLGPLCNRLTVTPFADCGHYPMQENPPLTVSVVERFFTAEA